MKFFNFALIFLTIAVVAGVVNFSLLELIGGLINRVPDLSLINPLIERLQDIPIEKIILLLDFFDKIPMDDLVGLMDRWDAENRTDTLFNLMDDMSVHYNGTCNQ